MKANPSPDFISDILNTMINLPKKDKIDPDVNQLLTKIILSTFTQFDIVTFHFQMRNGLSLNEVFSNYKFNYDTQLLDKCLEILENKTLDDNSLDFLYFIIMHNFIAREILLEKSKVNQPIEVLLKLLLLLSKKYKDAREKVIEKVFMQALISFLPNDNEYKTYDLLPFFFEYCQNHRDQNLFFQIFHHLSKNYRDERFTKFLSDFTDYLESNTTFFSEVTIYLMIPFLRSLLENFNITAFRFLMASTSNLSKRCADKLIPIVIQSIYSKLLDCEPIQVYFTPKPPEHFQITSMMTSDLNFFNTPTLPNGFDPLYSIPFPTLIDLNSFFDSQVAETLLIISEIFEDYPNDFVNWYIDFMNKVSDDDNGSNSFEPIPQFEAIPNLDPELKLDIETYSSLNKSNTSTSHFYNMYIALILICNQFSDLKLSSDHSIFFFHPLVFNLSDNVFDYLKIIKNDQDQTQKEKIKGYQILNTLRYYSLDFILCDDGQSIDDILIKPSVKTVPLFMAELFGRLANVSALFASKIEKYPKLIKTISNLARNYQHLEIITHDENKKEQIRPVRVSIFTTLAHLFSNFSILNTFFNDQLFIHTIMVFLFEEPVRPFIITSITKYLSNVDLEEMNIPFPNIINPILENINLHLPDHRHILLLKDLLTSFIEGFSYNQNEKKKFGNSCIIICHSMAYLDKDELSKEIYELGIRFLAMMASTFTISDLEVDALITGLARFNDEHFIESLYSKFISLLAGQKVPPTSPNFIIKKPQVLKLLLQTYSHPTKYERIIDYTSELCKYSPLNLASCSKSGIDLVLLNFLEKAKKNENSFSEKFVQKILDLYSLVTSHFTTAQSVLRYISLMSPLSETTISKYQLQFINTMSKAFSNSSDIPSSTFPLTGRSTTYEETDFKLIDTNGQFSLAFWIYIESDISKSNPKICSIRLSDSFKVSVILSNSYLFVELYVYLLQPSNSIEQSSISIPEDLAAQKWHFIVFYFNFNEKRSIIQYSIDCSPSKALLARAIPSEIIQQNPQCSIRLGGKYKVTDEKAPFNSSPSPSKIGAIGIFSNRTIEDFFQVFELGLRNNDKKSLPFHSHYYRNDFKEYDNDKPNGFTDVLIEKCGVNCLLPLFLQTDMIMDGKPFTLSLETIITLFVKLLTYSLEAQMSFSRSKGFNIIAELLTQRWTKYFTFKNYQQLFQLLLIIQYEQLEQQLFDEVMTNFTFLMMLDSDLHLRIIRHWMQALFPSFDQIAINFSSFEDLVSILRLFYWYKPIEKMWIKYVDIRPKDLNVCECRKYIMKLLFDYAAKYFDIDMCKCIVSHCVSCTELKQVIELIQLLISIFTENSDQKFDFEDDSLEYFVQYYMRYPNEEIRFLVLKLLILLHKSKLISDNFFRKQLDVIIAIIPHETMTKQLLDFLVSELKEDPFLLNLCIFISTYLDDISFISDLFIQNEENFLKKGSQNINEYLEKSRFWEIWFLWIAIYFKPDLTDTLLMLAKDHLLDLLIIYDLYKLHSEEFEEKFADFVISHVDIIKDLFLVCQRLIAFSSERKSLIDDSYFELFEIESEKVDDSNVIDEKEKYLPQNFVNTLFSEKIYKPKISFQLKFNDDFEWKHTQLAILFLSNFEKNLNLSFLQFDLLLCSFLQTTDFDVFDHLCSIYLHDKDLFDCDSILNLLEYHTITNGKRLFLKNVPFSNPFPSQQKFALFESQIYPKVYVDKIESRYEELTQFLQEIQDYAKIMKHVDVSPLIEVATKQMRNYLERQDFQNFSNIQSWQNLWSALSIERAPWHIQGKDTKLIRQREITVSYGLAPVKMIRNLQELPFWQDSQIRCKIEKRGVKLESQCAILRVEGRYPASFYLFRNIIKVEVQYGKNIDFQLKSIRFIFLRKNFGCQFFTDKGLSIHLEFPEDFFSKLVNEFDSVYFSSINSNSNIFIQKTSNQKFFQMLPYQTKWSNGEMSNYEYLLMLNHCVGRSFFDLQSYPFFPFILLSSSNEFDFRDFSSDFTDTKPFPRETVLSYLCAIEPFKSEDNDIIDQNNFTSFEDILQFVQKNNTEIVPEFYSMPEVLEKPNFILPNWSTSPIEFIYRHRSALESRFISSSLHVWITRMFGPKSEFKLFEGNHPRKEFNIEKAPLLLDNIERYSKPNDKKKVLSALIFEEMPDFTFLLLLDTGEILEAKFSLENLNSPSVCIQKMSSSKSINAPKSTSAETLGATSSSSSFSSHWMRNLIHSNSNVDDIVSNPSNNDSNTNLKMIAKETKRGRRRRESNINRKSGDLNPAFDPNFLCKIIGKINVPSNSMVIAKDERFIVASDNVTVFDSKMKKVADIEIESTYLSSISADGSCIVAAGGDNTKVSLIRGTKIDQSFQIYKDSISCISVSSVFNLVAVGTHDGSVVVCSATTGNLICIISLGEYRNKVNTTTKSNSILVSKSSSTFSNLQKANDEIKNNEDINDNSFEYLESATLSPIKVLITPSWGFIVVYCSEISVGRLKHSLLVFSLNGSFVKHCKIDGPVDYWSSWSSRSGFDYLIYTNETGHVFSTEVFSARQTKEIYCCRSRVVAAQVSKDQSVISIVSCDGKIALVPISI
ncbi:hypothetical protein M9Y10_022520 [Tritrichomonas musculus]|uniref:BEACH domain-containing protein n=1 Tax=Tritrichomonas musculus TaxID=1915356 RepID=A0ABR2KSQ3_9EUKA